MAVRNDWKMTIDVHDRLVKRLFVSHDILIVMGLRNAL